VAVVTVGYGDLVPKTGGGRCIAVLAMLIGIIAIALPVTVVGNTFHAVYQKMKRDRASAAQKAERANLLIASLMRTATGCHPLHGGLAVPMPATLSNRIQVHDTGQKGHSVVLMQHGFENETANADTSSLTKSRKILAKPSFIRRSIRRMHGLPAIDSEDMEVKPPSLVQTDRMED
jgi:hypothetical protein